MLKKTVKILLIILGVAVLAGLIALPVYYRGWPWWIGATIMAGILALVTGLFFVKRYYMRRREKKFVRRIVELDEAAIKNSPVYERQQLVDLQQHWKESVEVLHDSYLRKKGNPLYVLPWYLIIGESGAGKTTAINNARLSSPLTEMGRTTLTETGRKGQIAATRNCDWWFFKEAIILDSAGRYTIPVDEARDRDEWERFLALLAKYRRREPLNGLIVSVCAEDLKAANADKLRQDGQNIRKRIDQLMRVVGAKFPVYVLVTKMDLVYGFTEFFDALPESELSQAMGCVNQSFNPYWNEFLNGAWEEIAKRLRDLRFTFVSRRQAGSPPSLMFPAEFDNLKQGLTQFSQAVFEENPYQETPLFRGLYFSSALQVGSPQSDLLDYIHSAIGSEEPERKHKCLFLIDFFKNILPGDRSLFRPIREFVRWRRVTNSAALMAWLLICLFFCGLLTMSFVDNRMVVNRFKTEFQRLPAWSNEIGADLYFLEKLRIECSDMERANNYWFIPRLGLTESRELEAAMKRKYVDLFHDNVETRFDAETLSHVSRITVNTPEDEVAQYITFAVARINVLSEYERSGKTSPAEVFKRSAADLLVALYPTMPQDIAALYAEDYYAYLAWRGDKENGEAKLKVFLDALLDLQRNTVDLKWLVKKWIPDAPSVTIKEFWGTPVSRTLREQVEVPGAFTNSGRKHIESFIAMIESASPDKNVFAKKKADFWSWYQEEYLKSWSEFTRHFDDGELTLKTPGSRRDTAVLMTTDHNPYFRLFERVADETAWIRSDQAPPWLALMTEFNDVQKMARKESEKSRGTLREKIAGQKQKITEEFKTQVDQKSLDALNEREKMLKAWQDYVGSLDKVTPLAISKEVGFRMASDFFTLPAEMTQQSSSMILVAYDDFLKMKSMVQMKGDVSDVWNIVSGPLDYLLRFCIGEAASYLQLQWDGQVIGGLQGASKERIPQLLFDPAAGLVWKFLNGPAKPFIGKNKSGYIVRRVAVNEGEGSYIPFTANFLQFLNSGAESIINYQPEYQVQMETLPITTNHHVSPDPYGDSLTLQCTDGQLQLKNFNYPQKTVFKWSPDKCADTNLQIQFPDFTLDKAYKGRMGFANFLADFKDGSHTFTVNDFPEAGAQLTRLGIFSVTVSYKISGSKPILQLLNRAPAEVPQNIVAMNSD